MDRISAGQLLIALRRHAIACSLDSLSPDGWTARLGEPGHGVYAARATAGGEEWLAAVNVGVRPTFESGRGELIEAYLLDFDGDLYGKPLRIEFLKRLRGERRFASIEQLVEQMHRDVEETRAIGASAA